MPSFVPSADPAINEFVPNEEDDQRLIEYGDEPPMDGSIEYGQLIGVRGFMEEVQEADAGAFIPSA